jgi:hypothetical protein
MYEGDTIILGVCNSLEVAKEICLKSRIKRREIIDSADFKDIEDAENEYANFLRELGLDVGDMCDIYHSVEYTMSPTIMGLKEKLDRALE